MVLIHDPIASTRHDAPTMPKRRNVLIIGVSQEEFARVAPFLERSDFDVDRFPSGIGAIELTRHVGIEVLVVRFPLPDLELADFLGHIRQPSNPCLHSPVVLLANPDRLTEAQDYIGRGANRALDIESPHSIQAIQDTLSNLLHVAPRKAARFLARLEIKLGGAKDMILCQTENLSMTGMLIKTDRRYESGTRIDFEFSLPNDTRPISGIAEIVRHTMIGRDRVGGVGLRFLSFYQDSQDRFQRYLDSL